MADENYVYRVVRDDGEVAWEGRGSDPFTNLGSARRRATKLTNEEKRYGQWWEEEGRTCPPPHTWKVQRTKVEWEDFE